MSKQADFKNVQSIFALQKNGLHNVQESSEHTVRPWMRVVARGAMFFYCAQIVGAVMPAYAQVTPNKGAPAGQRPIMDAAQNGVPIVNIAPPSAAGVSRNQYNQLNVDPNGLILNNSRGNTQTQLGGWIAGNPQMGANPARIILNEVVSGNTSSLRGTIEVAGQKAAIVIANPNGVTCDGCGFLNADRASLVAGTPQFGANGSLNGFNVENGRLNIGALGLNAANVEQLDLIARGIVIEGEVWAKNLNAIAGSNQVLYGTLQSIAQNGSGTAPSFAIDIKELGGMYANQIYMVATEQGLGVNSTGRIAALQGNLTLSVNGDLGLTDSYAKQNLQIAAAGHIALKNKTIGDGAVRVAALGNLDNLGIVFSSGDLEMKAAQLTDTKGKLLAVRDISMQADTIVLNETTMTADGNASIMAATGNVEADKVKLYAGGNLDMAAAGNIVNGGGGAWQAAGNATLQAHSIDNRAGTVLANQALSLTTANGGLLDNQTGTLVGNTAVALGGSEIRNAQGTIATDGTLQVDTLGARLDNADGNIQAGADSSLAVASMDNTNGTLASGGNLTFGVSGDYTNKGTVSSEKYLTVNAANVTNSGTIHAGKKLTVNTGNLLNDGELSTGNLLADGKLDPISETALNLSGVLTNNATGVVDGSKTTVNANTVNNTGRVYGDALKVQVDTLNNSGTGVVAARGNMLLGARNINNTDGGLIYSLGDIAMARSFDSNGQAVGEVETVLNASAKIEAAGDISIAAKDVINRNDELTTTTTTTSTAITKKQIQRLDSDLTKYDPSQLGWSSRLGRGKGAYVYPSATYPFAIYGSETRDAAYIGGCNDETGKCNYHFEYADSDPIWDLFGVAPAQALANARALNSKIQAFNADLSARSFDDWYEYSWTSKNVTDTVLATTRPAEILAGKALTIDASNSVLNDNSSIVAGGAISIVGASVENRGTQGTRTETDVGTYAIRYVTRTTNSPELDWYPQGATTGAPVVTTTTLQAYTFKQNAADSVATRNVSSNPGSSPTKPLSGDVKDQLNGQTQYRDLTIPDSSLFKKASPGAAYLVETDPRFINKKNFLSSDYYLNKVGGSPDLQLKRYGDGFVEQQLVNDQILALTGRRYLSGYTSTEEEYKGLMDAGIAFAQQYQISPGVILSAEQMALLTTDIVLLIKQPVTLADGSIQEVLVPQVYLRRPQAGDLLPSGGLIAGSDVTIKSAGDLVNSGQIIAANENTLLAGNDLVNRDGRISGQDVYARASNDLKNYSGTILGSGENSKVALSAGRDIVLETRTIAGETNKTADTIASKRVNVDRIATVQGGDVTLDAGRDLIGKASVVLADKDLAIVAGRDIKVSAVETSYVIDDQRGGRVTKGRSGYRKEETVTNQLAVLGAGGSIVMAAGTATAKGDIALAGANATAGDSIVMQGTNVTIAAVKDSQLDDIQRVGKNNYSRTMRSDETLSGGVISAGNDLIIRAKGEAGAANASGEIKSIPGTGDVKLSGAYLQSQNGQVGVIANNNVEIGAITTEHSTAYEYYKKSKSLFSTKVVTIADFAYKEKVEGSVISGKSVAVQAGNQIDMIGDVMIKASQIVADNDLQISAGRNLTIGADQQGSPSYYSYQKKKSGMFSGGGFGVTIGSQNLSQKQWVTKETNIGSTVGSVNGDIDLSAGKQYTQTASQVSSPGGDISIIAQKVDINALADSQLAQSEQRFKQSGLTLALSAPVVSAVQSTIQMVDTIGKTSDGRMQALGAANAAYAAYGAVQEAGKALASGGSNPASISVSISLGSSKSESKQSQAATSAVGSLIQAGNNVNIEATGAGEDSDINVIGSTIKAGNDVNLKADGDIRLAAAQDTFEQHSTSQSSSASVGVALSFGSDGVGLGVTASANAARGNADGKDVQNVNSRIEAGNRATIESGGDTTLKGGVVEARQVVANVGGDLNIESLQDTSVYQSKDRSAGGSVMIGAGFGGSINVGKTDINGDYASVTEQSGIQAGDNGFQVNVKGNTDLKGGVIDSTEQAVAYGKNSLTTGTLTTGDIQNHDQYKASSSSIGLSGGYSSEKDEPAGGGNTAAGGLHLAQMPTQGNSAIGVGSASGSSHGTSASGISGGELVITDSASQQAKTGKTADETVASINRDVVTGEQSGNLTKNWDAQKLKEEVQAQVAITAAFGQTASKAIGDYAQSKMDEAGQLRAAALAETDPAKRAAMEQSANDMEAGWKEGGIYRVGLHSVVGGLTGNVEGALGAGISAATIPAIGDLVKGTDLPDSVKDALIATAGTAVGGIVGGTAGAAAGFNQTANNYLKHDEIEKFLKAKEACTRGLQSGCQERDRLQAKSDERDEALSACVGQTTPGCKAVVQEVRSAEAEIIRKGGLTAHSMEAAQTQSQADSTMSGVDRASGLTAGFFGAMADGVTSILKGVFTLTSSSLGNEEDTEAVRQSANALLKLSDPDTLAAVINAATASQREALAEAYETGDAFELGKIGGAVLSNLPMGLGQIKKVGEIGDIIKATEKNIAEIAAAKGVATEGKAVLGHFPEYKQLGDSFDARTFNIPEEVWDKMSQTERWIANQKFLDRMISRNDEIILATPLDKVRPGTYFARELEYLGSKGYVPSADGTRLIKR